MSTNEDVNTEHDKQISSENVVSSDFVTLTSVKDEIPEGIVSTPTGEDDEQVSKADVLEQKHGRDKEEITSVDIVPEVSVCYIQ